MGDEPGEIKSTTGPGFLFEIGVRLQSVNTAPHAQNHHREVCRNTDTGVTDDWVDPEVDRDREALALFFLRYTMAPNRRRVRFIPVSLFVRYPVHRQR